MDLRETYRRVMMALARAVVRRVAADGGMQVLQLGLMADETKDGVEHFEPYGFTSHPRAGAEAAVLFLGGNRDHGIAVVVADRRYRIRGLESGEVAIHDDQGQSIVLKRDGIVVTAPKVTVDADTVEVVGGSIDLGGAGGPAVARVGDMVHVGSGSSAGMWPIVTGSGAVRAT